MNSNSPSISLSAVTKTYGGSPVVNQVTLDIQPGETVALIGPSGAGKTTLLRMIAGVIPPDFGDVTALGINTRELHGKQLRILRREVGLLYQLDNLIPGLRVVHNVLMGNLGRWGTLRTLFSLLWPQQIETAREALREVELEHRLWALPGALSGGEQQRIAIARLLVQQPRVTLADEPVSSLDVRLGREIILLLTRIAKERSTALVVSLHALDLLGSHFDRVIALRKGSLVWQGRPDQITQSTLREVYGAEYESLSLAEISVGAAG